MNNKRNRILFAKCFFLFFCILITKNIYSQSDINPQLLAHLERINMEMANGNYHVALEILNNVIERRLINDITIEAEAYKVKGLLLFRTKRNNEALINIQHSIKLNPNDDGSFEILSIIYDDMGRYSDALEAINRAIEIDSHDLSFFSNRARTYLHLNELEKALNDVDYVLNINPQFHHALQVKAVILLNKNNYNEALLYINRAISINSSTSQYFGVRGLINYRLEKNDEAFFDFTRAIELGSKDPEVFKYRAWMQKERGNNQEAINDSAIFLQLSPDDIEGNISMYTLRALIHFDMGNSVEGVEDVIELFKLFDKEEAIADVNLRKLIEMYKKGFNEIGLEKDFLIKLMEIYNLSQRK